MSLIKSTEKFMTNKQTNEKTDSEISSITSLFGGKTESEFDNVVPNVNDLTTDDLFRLADLHFYKKNYIFRHSPDSYNKFIEEDVKNYLENEEHIFTENVTESTVYKYRFKFENIRIQEPMLNNNIEP